MISSGIPPDREIPADFLYGQLIGMLREDGFQVEPETVTWTREELESISTSTNPDIPVSLKVAAISMHCYGTRPFVFRFRKNGLEGLVVCQRDFTMDNVSIEIHAANPGTKAWNDFDRVMAEFEELKTKAYRW